MATIAYYSHRYLQDETGGQMNKTLSITLTLLMLVFLLMTPAIAQEGPDEFEPNDTS